MIINTNSQAALNHIIVIILLATHKLWHPEKREHLHHLLSRIPHILPPLVQCTPHSVHYNRDVWLTPAQLILNGIDMHLVTVVILPNYLKFQHNLKESISPQRTIHKVQQQQVNDNINVLKPESVLSNSE